MVDLLAFGAVCVVFGGVNVHNWLLSKRRG